MRRASMVTLFLLLAMLTFGCAPKKDMLYDRFGAETRYLQNNIHTYLSGRDIKASYANYTQPGAGHTIVPVNTPVVIKDGRRGHFIMTEMQHGREIHFEYHADNMRMPVERYVELITAPRQVNLQQLSEIDLKGIQSGRAEVGMTKDGVRMALGYPAAHTTPSLDENTWVYWKNRFVTMAVRFDETGRVVSVQ